jgi:hypothetical protein
MKTYCESCLPKQELFTLEDVEHIIDHVLGIDLPDALQMVKANIKHQEDLAAMEKRIAEQRGKPARVSPPCWDCKIMMPVLLHINEAREDD